MKSSRALNAPLDALASMSRDIARNLGTAPEHLILTEMFLGEVWESGSTEFPTLTGARYRVRRSLPKWTLSAEDVLSIEDDRDPSEAQVHVVATNLAEIVSASHGVAVGQPVHVFGVIVPKSLPVVHYFFNFGGGDEVWKFQVLAICTKPGYYTGNGYRVPATSGACADVGAMALPEGMTGGVNILIENSEENGLTPSHNLAIGSWGFGVRLGSDIDPEDGFVTPKILTTGGKYKRTHATLLGGGVPTEGVEGGSWDRDVDDGALNKWILSGLRVDPGIDSNCLNEPPTLIAQVRMESYDAGGKLYAVTADSEFPIATGCCPETPSFGTQSFSSSFASAEVVQQSKIARAQIALAWTA